MDFIWCLEFFICILRHIWILNAFDTKVIVWACFEEGWHVGWPVVLVSMCSSFRQNLTADDDPIMTCLIMFASFRTFSDRTHLNSQNSSHSPRLGWMENLQEAKDEISRFEAKTMIPSRFSLQSIDTQCCCSHVRWLWARCLPPMLRRWRGSSWRGRRLPRRRWRRAEAAQGDLQGSRCQEETDHGGSSAIGKACNALQHPVIMSCWTIQKWQKPLLNCWTFIYQTCLVWFSDIFEFEGCDIHSLFRWLNSTGTVSDVFWYWQCDSTLVHDGSWLMSIFLQAFCNVVWPDDNE